MTGMSESASKRRKNRSGLIGGLSIVVATAAILWVLAANEILNATTTHTQSPQTAYGVQPKQ